MHCEAFHRMLYGDNPGQDAELKAHAATCPSCRERMNTLLELSRIASKKHEKWDSPFLWPKIRNSLNSETTGKRAKRRIFPPKTTASFTHPWGLYTAVAFLALATFAALWILDRQSGYSEIREHLSNSARVRLLTDQALEEIEQTEAAYIESIDRLSELVEPGIAQSTSPLMINYREKLLLLDEAITECRKSIETNRYNAHLRRELLSIYQEKNKTLQEISREY